MGELSTLPNIAAKLEAQLAEVGITTSEQLKETGSQEAWLRILARDPSACLMRLSALEGALQGVRWPYLDEETKKSLKEFYNRHKGRRRQMPKPRKMLGSWEAPYVQALMKLIETQSKATIVNWCISYAAENILPVFEKAFPGDARPRAALNAARNWLAGEIKLPAVKKLILDAHAAAREAETNPAAQAAARTCGQAAATIHTPTHSLGLVLYGAAAIAYDRIGTDAEPEVYEQIAAEECAGMEAALRAVAVESEPNPAKINWNC
jgi:hypothetical protein